MLCRKPVGHRSDECGGVCSRKQKYFNVVAIYPMAAVTLKKLHSSQGPGNSFPSTASSHGYKYVYFFAIIKQHKKRGRDPPKAMGQR